MMANRLLPTNFEMNKYGLHARFVIESDAEFILSLRTNPKLSRYLHSTDNDVTEQKKWIKKYKEREANGTDYYFIYDSNGEYVGVNRIYNMQDESCTGGSWICNPDVGPAQSIATVLISRDVMFEVLGFKEELFEVQKGNNQVLKFHYMMGSELVEENEVEYHLRLKSNEYFTKREKIIKLLRI